MLPAIMNDSFNAIPLNTKVFYKEMPGGKTLVELLGSKKLLVAAKPFELFKLWRVK
jgi:hypothetical protein